LNEPRDEELLAAIGRGEKTAEKEFFLGNRQRAYRAAYRLLGNEPDALDAVSDAFVKAFKAAGAFRGESSAKTWFYRIVVNTAFDYRRRRRRTVSLDEGDEESGVLADLIAGDGETPPEAAARAETAVKIREAIDGLGEKHRAVFVLAAVEELSYKEISDTLGISIGTVMSRLFYARKYLQKSLSGQVEGGR